MEKIILGQHMEHPITLSYVPEDADIHISSYWYGSRMSRENLQSFPFDDWRIQPMVESEVSKQDILAGLTEEDRHKFGEIMLYCTELTDYLFWAQTSSNELGKVLPAWYGEIGAADLENLARQVTEKVWNGLLALFEKSSPEVAAEYFKKWDRQDLEKLDRDIQTLEKQKEELVKERRVTCS